MERLETLYAIWKADQGYDSNLGDALARKYENETVKQVQWMILWVLRKYGHPQANRLLAEAKDNARPSDLEVLKCIESGLDPKDPSIGMRQYEAQLQHINTLTARELEKITFRLYHEPEWFAYNQEVGDALAKRYSELPRGEEFRKARYWILKVLHQQRHPAFTALLRQIEASTDPDERNWGAELGQSKSTKK
jgi:hypothetical protein